METFSPSLPLATGAPFEVPSSPIQQYTTAQLLALSSAESAKVMVARCTDCFASGANTTTLHGDMVYWNGYSWMTVSDSIPPTTNWIEFALSKCRNSISGQQGPLVSLSGDTSNPTGALNGYLTGTAASFSSFSSSPSPIVNFGMTPGSTSTGSFRGLPAFSINAITSAPSRNIANVSNMSSSSTALSNVGVDNWYWKTGVGLPVFSSSAALQSDEVCFVMDDANTLGLGATGTQLYALVRLNGTTLDFVATGVNPSTTSKYLISSWEPTGPGVRDGRAILAVADDLGSSLTTIVSRTGSLSGGTQSLQPYWAGTKTLGTGVRTISRRWMKSVTYRTGTANGGVLF